MIALMLGWIIPTRVKAQIHQPRQRFFELGGGLADGIQVRAMDQTAYWLKVSVGRYGKKEGVWQLGFTSQLKYYAIPDKLLSAQQYFLEGTYAPKVWRTTDRRLYLILPVGLLMGYERANDEVLSSSLSRAMVGFTGGLSGEWNLSDKTALMGYARATFLPSSRIQPFHLQVGMGIRFTYFKR